MEGVFHGTRKRRPSYFVVVGFDFPSTSPTHFIEITASAASGWDGGSLKGRGGEEGERGDG
jgi:hypothetical protein